jgi:glycosyltransferase involved in cell wall biosynthesis
MRSILYLLPDLDFRGHARHASLLASALSRDQFNLQVLSLRGPGPFAKPIRSAGANVLDHGNRARFGVENWFTLRTLLAVQRPELVHVWGVKALRTLSRSTLFNRSLLPPIVVSLNASNLSKRRLGWWDRQLLKRIRAVVVMSDAERSAFILAGLPAERVHVIRPGVPIPAIPPDGGEWRRAHGVPLQRPLMMGVGHLESFDRFNDAVWAYEFLKYVVPDLQLVLIGDGLNRRRLGHHFRTAREHGLGVHFLGYRADAASLLQFADLVVVPHRRIGGTFAVLEGMAAGRPVVATRLPHLGEIIHDGQSGILVPPIDQPALARASLRLFENSRLRESIGSAAREAVAAGYRVESMADAFAALYDSPSLSRRANNSTR